MTDPNATATDANGDDGHVTTSTATATDGTNARRRTTVSVRRSRRPSAEQMAPGAAVDTGDAAEPRDRRTDEQPRRDDGTGDAATATTPRRSATPPR